ncbi:hypothetical protein AK88_01328 [Plasmodium fragile]|uniref:Repetitive organellar protein n=1 Tax=Plasmodium fragile TaxID=5857 RepID=A0A0D9QTL8_PLAFR|nr:uncharacterized protein AK88_01328 [Plasmodium fragile]KJP89036.1 hypothetical protein AK88_01328 [Plasmodium fragile]
MVFKFKKKKKEESSDKLSRLSQNNEGGNANEEGEKKDQKSNSWYKKIIDNAIITKSKHDDKEQEEEKQEESEANGNRAMERSKDYELEEQLKETLRSITSLSTKIVNYETKIEDLEKELKMEKDKQVDKVYEKELKEKENFIKEKIGMLNEKENLLIEKELDINMREEKINDREMFISKKEDKLNNIQEEYLEKNKEKEKLHFEIADIKISLEKLKYEVKDKKECLENVSNKVISKENALRELKEFIREKNEMIESLNAKITEKEKIYEQLGKDVEEKRKVIELLDMKANEKEKYFEERIKELEKEQNVLVQKLNDVKVREKEVETRENNFLHMEGELNDLRSSFSKNDCQLKIYKIEIKDLSSALVEKEREILDLKNTYDGEISLLKDQIKEMEKEIAKCSSSNDDADAQDKPSSQVENGGKVNKEEECGENNLTDLLKIKERELHEMQEKYAKEIDTLNSQLNEKRKEFVEIKNNYMNEINNVNNEIEESESKMAEMKSGYEMEINKLRVEMNAVHEEKYLLSNEKQTLNGEINKLNEEKEFLASEKEGLNNKVNTLNSEIATLNIEKHGLSCEINTLNDLIHTLKKEISSSDNMINKLKEQMNAINEEKEGKEKLITEIENNYKNEINVLKEKLKDTDNQMNISMREELDHIKSVLGQKEKEYKQMKEDYNKKIKQYDEELQLKQKCFENELNDIRVKSHEKEQVLILKNDELKESKLKTEEKYLKLYDDKMNLLRNICSKVRVPYSDEVRVDELLERVGDYISEMSERAGAVDTTGQNEEQHKNRQPIGEEENSENVMSAQQVDNANNPADQADLQALQKELESVQEEHREEVAKMKSDLAMKEKTIEESNNTIAELTGRINSLNDTISFYKVNNSEEKINSYVDEINSLNLTLSALKTKNEQEQLEKQNEITRLSEELSEYKRRAEEQYRNRISENVGSELKRGDERGDSDKEQISESDVEGGGNLKSFLQFPLRKIKGKKRKVSKTEKEIQTELRINETENEQRDKNEKASGPDNQEEVDKYKNELKEMEKIIEDLNHKIYSLTNEVMDLKNVKNELDERNNNLAKVGEEAERQREKLETLSATLGGANEEIAKLNLELERLKKEEAESRETAKKWEGDAEMWKEDVEKWKEDAEKWKEDAAKWKADADMFKANAEMCKADAEKWKEDAAKWKADADMFKANAEMCKADAEMSKANAETWRKEAEELKSSADQLNAELYSKENNYMLKLNENIGVIQQLKDSIVVHEKDRENYVSEIKDLRNQFEALTLKHDTLSKDYDALSGSYKELESKKSSPPSGDDHSPDGENKLSIPKENGEVDQAEEEAKDNPDVPKGDDSTLVVIEYINEIAHLKEEINRLTLLYSTELNEKNSSDIRIKELLNQLKELEVRDKENEEKIAALTKMNEKSKVKNEKVKSGKWLSRKQRASNEQTSVAEEEKKKDVFPSDVKEEKNLASDHMHILEEGKYRVMGIIDESNSEGGVQIIGSYLYTKNVENLHAINGVQKEDAQVVQKNVITVVCLILSEMLSLLFLNDQFVKNFEQINKNMWKLIYMPEEIKALLLKYFCFMNKLRNYAKKVQGKLDSQRDDDNQRYDDSWFLFQNYLESSSSLKRDMLYFILEEKENELAELGEHYDGGVRKGGGGVISGGKISDILNFSKDEMRLKTIAQLRRDLNFEKKSKILLSRDYQLLLYKYQECLRKLKRVKNMLRQLNLNDSSNRGNFALNKELDKYSDMSNEKCFHLEGEDDGSHGNNKKCMLYDDMTKLESRENVLINDIINLRKAQRAARNNLPNWGRSNVVGRCQQDASHALRPMVGRVDISSHNNFTHTKRLSNAPKISAHLDDMKKMKNIFNELVESRGDITFVHRSPLC